MGEKGIIALKKNLQICIPVIIYTEFNAKGW